MSHYRTIQALGTPHVIHQGLIDFLDDLELAIMLGHLLYWADKTDNPLGIYRSNAEWNELFRFKDDKVKKLSDKLAKMGLITKTHKRMEHRMYYLFNGAEFDRQYELFLSGKTEKFGLANPENSDSPILKNGIPQSEKSGHPNPENSDSFIQRLHTKNTTNNITPTPTPKTKQGGEYSDEFEQFWSMYPDKTNQSKKQTHSKFKLALKKVSFEKIMTGLKNYITFLNTTGNQFVKHATTWLNNECWESEYSNANQQNNLAPEQQQNTQAVQPIANPNRKPKGFL